jgi:hypothetical protein
VTSDAYGVRVRDHKFHSTLAPSSCTPSGSGETVAMCVPQYMGALACTDITGMFNGEQSLNCL